MRTLTTLEELSELVDGQHDLYLRWSRGPAADTAGHSRDDLSGAELPGLSANPLSVEEWWGDRPVQMWVARRLYDYRHLQAERGPGVRPWVLVGRERTRGPDNEPLVECLRPLAWVDDAVVDQATRAIESANDDWGPLDRASARDNVEADGSHGPPGPPDSERTAATRGEGDGPVPPAVE
jgi:hypothetical protein